MYYLKKLGKKKNQSDKIEATLAQLAGAVEYTDYRGVRFPQRYDTKQSDGEALVMLELWGMWSTLLLPLLPSPFRLGVVAPDRVLSMGQIELNCVLMLNCIVWNRTVLPFKLCTDV